MNYVIKKEVFTMTQYIDAYFTTNHKNVPETDAELAGFVFDYLGDSCECAEVKHNRLSNGDVGYTTTFGLKCACPCDMYTEDDVWELLQYVFAGNDEFSHDEITSCCYEEQYVA